MGHDNAASSAQAANPWVLMDAGYEVLGPRPR